MVNSSLVETYWHIGQYIVEYEQGGSAKAEYGLTLLGRLAKDLSLLHGKGFGTSNLANMRLFYSRFPIFQTVSGKLELDKISELSALCRIFSLSHIPEGNLCL